MIDYLANINFQQTQQLDPNALAAVGYIVGGVLAGFFGSLVQRAFSKTKNEKEIDHKVETRVAKAQEPQNEKLTALEHKYEDLKTFSDGQQLVNNELREARSKDAEKLHVLDEEIKQREILAKQGEERIRKVEEENQSLRQQLKESNERGSRLELEMAGLRGQLSVYELLLKPFLADLANSIVKGNGITLPPVQEAATGEAGAQ